MGRVFGEGREAPHQQILWSHSAVRPKGKTDIAKKGTV